MLLDSNDLKSFHSILIITSVRSQYKGVKFVLTSTLFYGTNESYYKSEVANYGINSVLVPFGTDTNLPLSPIVSE